MSFDPFGTGFGNQVQTPAAGVALVNGTPDIISWQVPDNGQQHPFMVIGQANVTGAETGGEVQVTYTPASGAAGTLTLSAGGLGTGVHAFTFEARVAAPGSVVTVTQSTALTAGAAVINASIIGQ